ncbi:hypothetical protein [Streptomyces phaeochromogenes]|uniref:hypothetical protein n=1 Tax=Streptomyces phaeochromogenes TaxID=1923 RepID=UPI002DDA2017|nr:hypothetical protein [Streptomyces phaeochromogenes]WRZ28678.1 hypothetical protein OG931_13395 [Streptomyces phaeochromogenes]
MDGDSRSIDRPFTTCETYDEYDSEWWEGDMLSWVVGKIDRTGVTEPSAYPIGDAIPEHAWLSGRFEGPYEGDSNVTERCVRLTGDWSPQQRAEAFRGSAASDPLGRVPTQRAQRAEGHRLPHPLNSPAPEGVRGHARGAAIRAAPLAHPWSEGEDEIVNAEEMIEVRVEMTVTEEVTYNFLVSVEVPADVANAPEALTEHLAENEDLWLDDLPITGGINVSLAVNERDVEGVRLLDEAT